MKTKLTLIFLFFCLIVKAQYNDVQGNLYVGAVLNDTVIKIPVDNQSTITGSKGYFYFDYTSLTSVDGTLKVGVVIYCGGLEKFVPYTSSIVLSHSVTEVTINNASVYMFETIDGFTTWQVAIMFEYLPGDIPAFKYVKTSADTGVIRYRYKSILKN
jgi:hypothetical protein